MTKEVNKKQHYIPVCYLKNFSENDKFVYVYNKNTSKHYPNSIEKIFCKDDFYRIPIESIPKSIKDKVDPLWIERVFFRDNIESQYSDFLKELIFLVDDVLNSGEDITQYRIPVDFKYKLAFYAIIQYFRTPEARQGVLDYIINIENTLGPINRYYEKHDGVSLFPFLSASEKVHNPVIAHFAVLFLHPELIQSFAESLSKNIWQIWVAKDDTFFTSDQPIMFENFYGEMSSIKYDNLNLFGDVLSFPLSRKIVAKMYDKDYFSQLMNCDRGCIFAKKEFIMAHNVKQYLWAKEYVVSYSNDFRIIEDCKNILGKEYSVRHKFIF